MYENIFDDHIHLTCTVTDAADIIQKHTLSALVNDYSPNENVRIINLFFGNTISQSLFRSILTSNTIVARSYIIFVNIVLSESDGGCNLNLTVSDDYGRKNDIEYHLYHANWKKLKSFETKRLYNEFTPAMYELLHFCPDFEFDD